MVQSDAVSESPAPPSACADTLEVATLAPASAPLVSWRDRLQSLLEVILVTGVLTQLLVAGAMLATGLPFRAADGSLNLLAVALPTLVDTGVSLLLVSLFLRARGEAPRGVLLGQRRATGEALVGVALTPLVFLVVAALSGLVQALLPWLHDVPDNPLADLMKTPWSAAVMGVIAVVGGGVREEVQRGFILHRFEQHLGGRIVGLVLFSVLFGLGHAEVQGWDAAIYTGTLGLIWGATYFLRGSVVAPMVSHAIFNGLQVAWQFAWA